MSSMKETLNKLILHQNLSKQEAKEILVSISDGAFNPSQIAAFLTVYLMRTITIDELEGFRDALLELCIKLDVSGIDTIDLCGTGGDGKNTFNISTLASFVVAGAGIHVTKHGNYGVSSVSGSSNVMEQLGVKFSNESGFLLKCLDKAGICILHAPLFHPAMKNVGGIRRELGIKTFFNMLGPMVNPALPKFQMVGVFNLELARAYGYLYQRSAIKYTILHALDGYDEVSLTSNTKAISNKSERLLTPKDFGVEQIRQEQIYGGDTIEQAAQIFKKVISGHGTEAQNNVVCANAAVAISTVNNYAIADSFAMAKESLTSGKANKSLKMLIELSGQ